MTREEAVAAGLHRYNTGKPCVSGHMSDRYTKTTACVQCSIENGKRWKNRNLDASQESDRARKKRHYDANKGEYIFKARKRKQNLDAINELLPGEWEAVVEQCGNVCIVPGCTISPVTQDHVTPVSAGGRHHISNL